ncbi:hypothetical protein FB45DRAFT_1124327 [Roridomyces roridus]|uniref:Zn(2)-C6 fungal-type domain-containing protein n=1 Tax=Roridomyces roridus TaxID=1738132 RepID=A0AAD7FVU2_9AGAR|nr:hypothetical protein FB45DRAFT_1124327 [Roridomyces roridus]
MNEPFSFDPRSPLQKGKACFNCRRRKTKCDAAQPICGPCSRFKASLGDCQYPSRDEKRSLAEVYEDRISQCETRIAELERASPPQKLTSSILNELTKNFLENSADCFGFFLDRRTLPRIQELSPALADVLHLCAVHLSADSHIASHEPAFLEAALRSQGNQPTSPLLHRIQSSVLLAYYFLHNARLVEGGYHAGVAVALAVGGSLHCLRNPRVESQEDVAAFWSVMNLNNCWAGHLSNWPAGLQIYTPWPGATVGVPEQFLAGLPDNANSCAAWRAKAGVLSERTSRLVSQYSQAFDLRVEAEVTTLDARIDAFKAALPPVQSKAMMVVHMLAHVCTIQLHTSSLAANMDSLSPLWGRNKALAAARGVVDVLANVDVPRLGAVDPVLAILWSSTCLVLIRELGHAKSSRSQHQTNCVVESFKVVIAAMQICAAGSRVMGMSIPRRLV